MKVCTLCLENKTSDNFEFRKDTNSYRNQCKICKSSYYKKWKLENKEKIEIYDNNYRLKNRKKITESHKKWRDSNIEKINKRRKIIYRKNMTNEEFRILQSCRARIRNAVIKKSDKTLNLLGCSSIELRKWLEYLFYGNMSWKNYGNFWQIDHVIPCASFNLNIEEEQYKCFNWKNLRPFESKRNSSKGKNITQKEIVNQEILLLFYQQTNK